MIYGELEWFRQRPDERYSNDSRQGDCQLEISPVTDEERQQSQEHPRCCPEQFQRGAGKGTMYGRKQFARHYYPDKPCTLHTPTHTHTHTHTPLQLGNWKKITLSWLLLQIEWLARQEKRQEMTDILQSYTKYPACMHDWLIDYLRQEVMFLPLFVCLSAVVDKFWMEFCGCVWDVRLTIKDYVWRWFGSQWGSTNF